MGIRNPSTRQEANALLLLYRHYGNQRDLAEFLKVAQSTISGWIKKANAILEDRQPFQNVKILHYDIEVYKLWLKPQLVYDLKQSEKWYEYEDVHKDKAMMMFAWAWHDEKKVNLESVVDDATRFVRDHYDDSILCQKLADLFNKADIVVAYNGDAFDWKTFQWRCLVNRIEAPKKPIMIDLFKIVKKQFKTTSNKLDAITRALDLSKKARIPNQDRCAKGDPHAIIDTGNYCMKDIPPMIDLLNLLAFNGYIRDGLYMNIINGDKNSCITCGMKKFVQVGYDYTRKKRYNLFKCTTCKTQQRKDKA